MSDVEEKCFDSKVATTRIGPIGLVYFDIYTFLCPENTAEAILTPVHPKTTQLTNQLRPHRERGIQSQRVASGQLLRYSTDTYCDVFFFFQFFLSLVQEGILKAHALGAKVGINLGSSGIVRSQRLSSLRWSVSSFSGQFESESFRNNVRYVYFIDDKLIRCISCLVDIFLVKTCLVKSSSARGGSGNKMYMHV